MTLIARSLSAPAAPSLLPVSGPQPRASGSSRSRHRRSHLAAIFGAVAAFVASLLPAQGGTWATSGSQSTGRASHASTSLLNGDVVVAGGYDTSFNAIASAERFDFATGTWLPLPAMSQARVYPTATTLPNGKVLVVGGGGGPSAQTTAEFFDPSNNTWSAAPPPPFGFMGHEAVNLNDGRVLVVGGITTNAHTYAAIFDPVANTWQATGSLILRRHSLRAITLVDGRVLVAGGSLDAAGGWAAVATCEVWSPVTGTWTSVGTMAAARSQVAASRLRDGRVLITGGGTGGYAATATADLFDPFTNTLTATGSMVGARGGQSSTLLPDGRVLVAAGWNGVTSQISLNTAELYDPITGAFTSVGSLTQARCLHSAHLLPNGSVLTAGGRDLVPNTMAAVSEVFTLSIPITCGTLTAYGVGTAGAGGTPTISGSGCAHLGQTITLSTHGTPYEVGVFAIGSYPLNVLYNGLTILQSLDASVVVFLDGAGDWSLPLTIPLNPALSTAHCYFQAAYLDFSTPSQLNATAGLDVQIL